MTAHPHPLTCLFYSIQFQRDPFTHIEHIVDRLLPRRQLGTSAAELAGDIDAALASGESLAPLDMSEYGLTDETLRAFLVELRARLPG